MNNSERIKKKLLKANDLLYQAWHLLKQENEGDKQMDFVNTPELSDPVNYVLFRSEKINNIFYQKNR